MFSYFLLQKFCVSIGTCQQVTCEMFIKRSDDLDKKIISLVLFDTNRSFKWLTFCYFNLSSRKVVCFGMHFQVACLDCVSLCRKNVIFWLCLLYEDACILGSM